MAKMVDYKRMLVERSNNVFSCRATGHLIKLNKNGLHTCFTCEKLERGK